MKHEWFDISGNDRPFRRFRKCDRCGIEQEHITEHHWMRVVGYRWLPLVGRCKGTQMKPEPPEALDRIADKVLSYRPKDKRKKPRKRKRPKKAKKNG